MWNNMALNVEWTGNNVEECGKCLIYGAINLPGGTQDNQSQIQDLSQYLSNIKQEWRDTTTFGWVLLHVTTGQHGDCFCFHKIWIIFEH